MPTELVDNYSSFDNVFLDIFDRNAPIKKKVIRANYASYVTKALKKAIMKRPQLEKIYFTKITEESFKKLKKQKEITAVDYTKEREKVFLKP